MNVLQFLNSMRPAIPLSREKPGGRDKSCSPPSNGELRRWISDGSVLLNGNRWTPDEEMPPAVLSLVFFPKSIHRTTVI